MRGPRETPALAATIPPDAARRAASDDGRAQTLTLTPRGSRLIPQLAACADQNDAEFFGGLTKAERETLERLLKRLVEHGHMTAAPIE